MNVSRRSRQPSLVPLGVHHSAHSGRLAWKSPSLGPFSLEDSDVLANGAISWGFQHYCCCL